MHEFRARFTGHPQKPCKIGYKPPSGLEGHLPDWVIGRMGVMEFLASGHGDTALVNDLTVLRGIQHVDAGPRQAASFVLADQLVQS